MKRIIPVFFCALFLIIIGLPTILARGCQPYARPEPIHKAVIIDRTPIISPAGERNVRVFLHNEGKLTDMTLEEYLLGVVAAEMPAAFEPEALKAQAVCARTYTVNQMKIFGGKGCSRHPDADICTDSTHCQAWVSEEQTVARWSAADAALYLNKIRMAVRATAGEVITFDGAFIDAVFHSTCGGHTENSEDVWSSAQPYLRGVVCPYCKDTRWSETVCEFTATAFADAIVSYVSAMPVSAAGRPLLGEAVRSSTGRIKSLTIAGETVTGRDFRRAFGLPSTHVTWKVYPDKVIFTAAGYGHGVGLCQYGADGMAKAQKTYQEILKNYYTGVEIVVIAGN